MQENSFVVPTIHFAIAIKFSLLKQNVLLGQKKSFVVWSFSQCTL